MRVRLETNRAWHDGPVPGGVLAGLRRRRCCRRWPAWRRSSPACRLPDARAGFSHMAVLVVPAVAYLLLLSWQMLTGTAEIRMGSHVIAGLLTLAAALSGCRTGSATSAAGCCRRLRSARSAPVCWPSIRSYPRLPQALRLAWRRPARQRRDQIRRSRGAAGAARAGAGFDGDGTNSPAAGVAGLFAACSPWR